MAFAETKRLVMVEYPIDVVYETLVYLFPLKTLRLKEEYESTRTVVINDASNYTFIMHVKLTQNTPNTTFVYFLADYPHAIADISGGGKKSINLVLGELLTELEKQPKPENVENEYTPRNDVEVINSKIFASTTKTGSDKKMIIAGYVLCILMIILPFIEMSLKNQRSSFAAILIIGAILCFCLAMTVATLLSFNCDARKSIMHGRIQAVLCGLFMILIACFLENIVFIILAILIPGLILGYSIKRDRDTY